VFQKGSYQTHGGNFIPSQLIIKISRTVLCVCGLSFTVYWLHDKRAVYNLRDS